MTFTDEKNDGAADHRRCAVKATPQLPTAPSPNDGKGQGSLAKQASRCMPAPSPIDQLAELQVRRKFYIAVVNKQTNAAKALVRRALGWRYDDEEAGREKMNARAARIVAAALAGKEQAPEDASAFGNLAFDLATVAAAIEPCKTARHIIELEMQRIARKLPVYPWAKSVRGLGERALAVVVAEAGDLSGYPTKGHLWKRLGLAPLDGKAYSTWRSKGGLSAEQWTDAGYSPRRRAEIYALISEPLLRGQTPVSGPYRAIYDRRRQRTAESHPDWTDAHSHMDALRVMTKYLIRDLWSEWRRAAGIDLPAMASDYVPPVRQTDRRRKAEKKMPLADAEMPTGGGELATEEPT
ncbi:hypothetical protein GOC60_17245 [Sinorhizobium meliloti]|nr:hypothetical protein [Sinorhizobium meliloti]MDX0350208.1 hypothetical protein [Sinorhizobium meliloti]